MLGVVLGQVTKVVVDLAFVVEGRAGDELPEGVLGAVRVDRADVRTFAAYDDDAAAASRAPAAVARSPRAARASPRVRAASDPLRI